MSSPKGSSKHPQSFVYKDGESKLIEQSEFDAHIADGWCDNPDGVATASEEVADSETTSDAEVTDPVVDETADEGSESKGLMGSLKDMVTGGGTDETPDADAETGTNEAE